MYAHTHEANQFEYALKIITVLSTAYSIKEQGDVHAYILATGLMYMYAHTGKSVTCTEHALKLCEYGCKFY